MDLGRASQIVMGEQNLLATPTEKYFHGLLKGKHFSRINVEIIQVLGRGRGAAADKDFKDGDFICEYAACVRPKNVTLANDENRYSSLELSCCELDTFHEGQYYMFYATGTINDPRRYINHASWNTCNLILTKLVFMTGHLRIGFVAKRNIQAGEEVFYDYGVRDKEIPWFISDGKAMVQTKPAAAMPSQQPTTLDQADKGPYIQLQKNQYA